MTKLINRLVLVVFTLCLSSLFSKATAQYLDLKGLAVGAYSYDDMEDGETKNFKCDEVYSFSFNDKILCHSIYEQGQIKESQFYELSNVERMLDGKITVYKAKSRSGVSGNLYGYVIQIAEDGKLIKFTRIQPDESKTDFYGDVIPVRTFKQ